jgi:hypothetical protein
MDEIWMRLAENMSDRVSGPMHLRFVIQPIMATIFAVLAGLKDARAGKSPYFWALLSDPANRVDMLKDGWKSVGKIFVLAVILDLVFQYKVLDTFYPGEVIVVAFLLAIVPYLIVRGLVNRLARKP